MRPPPTHAPRDRASILERRNQAKAYLSISFCALLSLPASGQMAQSAQQRMEAVQNHLSRYVVIRNSKNDEMNLLLRMKELDVPAVSIAAIRNGAIDWAHAYGVSSIQGPTSINGNSLRSGFHFETCYGPRDTQACRRRQDRPGYERQSVFETMEDPGE